MPALPLRTAPDRPPHDRLGVRWSRRPAGIPKTVVQPLQAFLATEIASAAVLLAAALIALVWVNSPVAGSYAALWESDLTIRVGSVGLTEPLRLWVNDLLMAFFFFVVGLEVKRELIHGELRDPRRVALPLVAALGGMVVPALFYLAVNAGGAGADGWGIPIPTDIAFAIGVLALVGRRAPASLRVFLLALAVADDIGAILVIAVVYSVAISVPWLLAAAAVLGAVVGAQRLGIRALPPYVLLAGLLWLAVFASGVHPTIAGVLLGLLTPAHPFHPPLQAAAAAREHVEVLVRQRDVGDDDEDEQAVLLHVAEISTEAVSPLVRLQERLHPWTSFVVLPLFALANAGVAFAPGALARVVTEPVTLGVLLGLVLGKPVGILAGAALAVATRRADLPEGSGWRQLAGVGLLGGVGFTVSIFVAGLAFPAGPALDAAKVGILVASVAAGALGALLLALPRSRSSDGPAVTTR